MKAEEIEFFLLLKERIDNLANSSDVDQGKVSEIFERFLKLSKNHLIQPSLNYSSSNDELKAIKSDTQHIRFAVELMSDCTIDYSFILNSRVQNQLIRDNLRMENSRLSNEIKSDMDRFYSFCTYAFYQIEELINYYYYKNCASFGLFVEHIKLFYPNMKINSEKNISDVKSSIKIKSFEIKFLISKVYEHSFLDNIRITRNTESHRCSIIENLTNEQLFLELEKAKNDISDYYRNTQKEPSGQFSEENYSKLKVLLSNRTKVENNMAVREFLKEKNYNKIRDSIIEVANFINHTS